MPWSNNNGNGQGPWGQRPRGQGPQPPDLEELYRKTKNKLQSSMSGGPGGQVSAMIIALGVLVLLFVWGLTGVQRIEEGYNGLVLQFGKYHRTLDPGLSLTFPYPIHTVDLVDVESSRRPTIGTVDSGAQRGAMNDISDTLEKIDTAIEQNDDITTTSSPSNLILTGDRQIVDISYTVNWILKDSRAYLYNILAPEQTVEDVARAAMSEIIGKEGADSLISEQKETAALEVRDLIQKTLDEYESGILVQSVNIQHLLVPNGMVRAMYNDANAAQNDQATTIERAHAIREKLIPEAEGRAKRLTNAAAADKEILIQSANEEVANFDAVYSEFKKSPDVVRQRLYLEKMENALSQKKKILIDGGAGTNGGSGVLPILNIDGALNSITKSRGGQ